MGRAALIVSLVLFITSCAEESHQVPSASPEGENNPQKATYTTPTRLLAAKDYPVFSDDKDFAGLKLAITRQLIRLAQKNLNGTIKMGTKSYPLTKVKTSLEILDRMIDGFNSCKTNSTVARCYQDFNSALKARFDVYVPNLVKGDPRYGEEDSALFTGYHTMPIEGTLQPSGDYKFPIYGNPGDPKLFFSRLEIDFLGKLVGKGLELIYTKSLFDIYLLHVQGSGRATLVNPDGSKTGFYLNYDGTNKQKWVWISKHMMDKGYINNPSIPAQRKFLRARPDLHQEIFATCPSYVFTKMTTDPPMGNDAAPVTDARSIAQDSGLYSFKGLIAYVDTTKPVENGHYDLEIEDPAQVPFARFSRFFLDQDTGGAIKGKARADIYFGEDLYSQFSAQHMKQTGKIYYMIAK